MTITRLHLRASGTTRPSDEQVCSALHGLGALAPSITWQDDHAIVTIDSWSKPAIVFLERTLHHLGPYKIDHGKLEITKVEIVPRRELKRAG
jgi:hypothetical protein